LKLGASEHVGAPTSQRRQRQFPRKYNECMTLMSECIVTEPSSFEEAVQQPTWVDAMIEE